MTNAYLPGFWYTKHKALLEKYIEITLIMYKIELFKVYLNNFYT